MTAFIEPDEQENSSIVVGVGSQLRKARESRQLSQMDVAEQLYLEESTVSALEKDDYAALPESIFVKGYIRNYSRLVGLNPEALIKLYENSEGQHSLPVLKSVCKTKDKVSEQHVLPRWQILSLGALGLVLLLSVYFFNSSELTEKTVTTEVLEKGVDIALSDDEETTLLEEVIQSSEAPEIQQSKESTVNHGSNVKVEALEAVETIEAAPVVSHTESAKEVTHEEPLVKGHATMKLNFIRDSWVEISDATGQRLYFDLAKDGDELNLSGVAPFDVLLGYAIGVTIQYNGEPFDLMPYIRGKMARFTLGKAGDKADTDEL